MQRSDYETAQQTRRRISPYEQQTGDVHAPGRFMVSMASGLPALLGKSFAVVGYLVVHYLFPGSSYAGLASALEICL